MNLSETELLLLQDLLTQSTDATGAREKVEAANRAVELAEKSGVADLLFDAKQRRALACTWAGKVREAIPDVIWCLSQLEQHAVSEQKCETMTRVFSFFLSMGTGMAEISARQFEELLNRFGTLVESSGHSSAEYYGMRMEFAISRGDREQYHHNYKLFREAPSQRRFECKACTQNKAVHAYFCLGDYERALETAEPLLDGTMSCGEVPGVTYGAVLRALVESGDIDHACELHRQGLASMQRIPRLLDEYAPHVAFLVYRQDWAELIPLVNELLQWPAQISSSVAALRFYYAVRPLPQYCPEQEHAVRLPGSGVVDRETFAQHIEEQIEQLALALDQRNGNDFASTTMAAPYTFPTA